MTPELKPETSTGVKRLDIAPSPIWPLAPFPQHLTAPVLKSAQVCIQPTEIAVTPELKPETSVGVKRSAPKVPSPI